MEACIDIGNIVSQLKCHYDENHICSIDAILKHKQVACMRRKMLFTISFQYLPNQWIAIFTCFDWLP